MTLLIQRTAPPIENPPGPPFYKGGELQRCEVEKE